MAPIGEDPQTGSLSAGVSAQYFYTDGCLTARVICEGDAGPQYCLAALDPVTSETLAGWVPRNQTLLSPYGMVTERNILMPTFEGGIIELERLDDADRTSLKQTRALDLLTALPDDFTTTADIRKADSHI